MFPLVSTEIVPLFGTITPPKLDEVAVFNVTFPELTVNPVPIETIPLDVLVAEFNSNNPVLFIEYPELVLTFIPPTLVPLAIGISVKKLLSLVSCEVLVGTSDALANPLSLVSCDVFVGISEALA